MRGLRVHDELATDRLSRLEERTYPVHVAPRKGDDCELLLQRRQEANGVLLHVGLGQRAPRIVRRDPRAFRDQDDRFRRGRRGDKVLRQHLLRSVVTEVPGVRDRPHACMHEVAVGRRGAVVDVDGFDIEAVDGLCLARAERLVRVRPELQDRRARGRVWSQVPRRQLPECSLGPAAPADAAIEREVRHGTPRVRGQSASCTTITSRTAFIDRKLSRSRPSGSVLKRRVSTVSAGVTRSDWIRPVFVSTRKSARTPRIWPSSVMTVLPRSSVAKTFSTAAARILASLFFLSGLGGRDAEAKPSASETNELARLGTALSYRAGGVFSAPQRKLPTWTISLLNAALSSASSPLRSRRTIVRRMDFWSGTGGPGS